MSERKWTPAQNNALSAESGTLLVSAAAGSGKTAVLVERIVRKITDKNSPVAPESLLVVTFTNAAAAEMKSRIFARIAKKTEQEPERREEYSVLLSRLSEMQICTMDSFCMNLVKENCHTLGIDADFKIIEEAKHQFLKKKTAESVCEKRFSQNKESFSALADMFQAGRNDMGLINSIIKLSDFSMSEASPEDWLISLNQNFEIKNAEDTLWGKNIINDVLFALDYCLTLSEGALCDIGEDEELESKLQNLFENEKDHIKKAVNAVKTLSWDEKIIAVKNAITGIKSGKFSTPKGYGDNPSKNSAKAKRDEYKAVLDKIPELLCCTNEENREDTKILKPIAKELISTVIEYNRTLLETKKEMSEYSFSDISAFALSLLYDKNAPDRKTALAREITAALSEILIDEYQDTNRAQDTLFSCISKDGNNQFLVGDVKQSIYRFRLASPEIFIEKCDLFPYYDEKAIKSKIILSENFRSRKNILSGINFIFSSLMSRECGDITYNDDEKLNFPQIKTAENTPDVHFDVIETNGENAFETEAKFTVSKICEMLKSAVVDDGDTKRKAEPSDFAVLVRSKTGTVLPLIKEFKAKGIPVSSESLQSFFETPEIKTVMSYLKVIDNPARDIDLLAVMLSPLFGFSESDAAALRVKYGKHGTLYSLVLKSADSGDEKCIFLKNKLNYYKKMSACCTPDMLLREIYTDTSYPLIVSVLPEGLSRKNNLYALLQKASEKSETYSTLGAFLRFTDILRENGDSEFNAPGETQGVKIMSMHKSKGLEFPFVFIVGTQKQFNKTDIRANLIINHNLGIGIKRKETENLKCFDTLSSVCVKNESEKSDMSEELRILYVALTRAKQELFIVSAMNKAQEKIEKTEYLLSNLPSIPPYAVRHATNSAKWFLMSFLRHPDAKNIRFVTPDKEKPKGEAIISFIENPKEQDIFVPLTAEVSADEDLLEQIRQKAAFSYKYSSVAHELSKHTASSLKDEHFDPAGFGKSVPSFMFKNTLSPSDIGTATHRFLQYCDFSVCKNAPEKERERLVKNGRLSQKEASCVDMEAIKVFVNSDIMKRMENAKAYYKEKQFTVAKSIRELKTDIPEEFSDEKTVIIGKLDLLFIEDDSAVIVDYKTDNISDINVLPKRYRSQMELYIEAIEKSMELKVKECILYSLKLKQSISMTDFGN